MLPPRLFPPWLSLRLLAGLAGLAAVIGLLAIIAGWRADAGRLPEVRAALAAVEQRAAAYRQAVEAHARAAREQAQRDAGLLMAASGDLAQLRAEREALLDSMRGLRLVVRAPSREHCNATEPAAADGPLLSALFRVCVNAAWGRDAADRRACAAGRMPDPADGRAVPAAQLVRSGAARGSGSPVAELPDGQRLPAP